MLKKEGREKRRREAVTEKEEREGGKNKEKTFEKKIIYIQMNLVKNHETRTVPRLTETDIKASTGPPAKSVKIDVNDEAKEMRDTVVDASSY